MNEPTTPADNQNAPMAVASGAVLGIWLIMCVDDNGNKSVHTAYRTRAAAEKHKPSDGKYCNFWVEESELNDE